MYCMYVCSPEQTVDRLYYNIILSNYCHLTAIVKPIYVFQHFVGQFPVVPNVVNIIYQ